MSLDRVRQVAAVPRNVARIVPGWAKYLMTGQTPPEAYSAMRRLYVLTNGRFNDVVSSVMRVGRPPYALEGSTGVAGDMQGAALERVVSTLDQEGVYIFEQPMEPSLCDEIERFAKTTPCLPRREGAEKIVFDGTTQSLDPVLDFAAADLLRCAGVRRLLTDNSLLTIAQSYLRARAVLDTPMMWWSTPGTGEASSAGAQLFHFDMDRLKFLKFFVYLTDVSPDNGPHCFARGSHTRKPPALLNDGRHTDEEIAGHYGERMVEITGKRGTMILADTRGFHKGKVLRRGVRLIYEMEFANSMFGQSYPRVTVPRDLDAGFTAALGRYPFTYANFPLG